MMTDPATIGFESAIRRTWDVVVIGGGPSGSVAALESARKGAAVLLVDRSTFPRPKVCGACLNLRSLSLLDTLGVGSQVARLHPIRLSQFLLAAGGRRVPLELPGGVAVSRSALDTSLVNAAIDAGAEFLAETSARVESVEATHRPVALRQRGRSARAKARVVIVAGGLSGGALENLTEFRVRTSPRSRVGVGAVVDTFPDEYRRGVIFMAVGRGGYVGMVRVEDGRLNIAAALDPQRIRQQGGPGPAIARLLQQAGLPQCDSWLQQPWRGTRALTRRTSPLAGERVFVVGDAAGYVEPFTGEGITWALASGRAVAPVAVQAAARWHSDRAAEWTRIYETAVGGRQRVCRGLALGLRQPVMVAGAVRLLSGLPALATPVIRRLNSSVVNFEPQIS